jgi:hypothetical protein
MDEKESFECTICKNSVSQEDEFCPECGTIFSDDISCINHPNINATGVCIICCIPFCDECGLIENKHFLCNDHVHYEIIEGMAKIYSVLDYTNAEYVKSCLELEGFHPFIFCKVQPKGGSGLVQTLFEAQGDTKGHSVAEIKVMVPCQEVMESQLILEKLDIKS